MQITHQVVLTEEYLEEVQRIAIAQNAMLRFLYQSPWAWWPARVGLVAFMIFLMVNHVLSFELAVLFGSVLVATFIGEFLGRRNLARARQRNPLKGSQISFSMNEQGLDTVGPNSNAHVEWPGFSRVIIYANGVLLKMQSRALIWLPDQSLTAGTPADVRQLLANHIKDCVPAPR